MRARNATWNRKKTRSYLCFFAIGSRPGAADPPPPSHWCCLSVPRCPRCCGGGGGLDSCHAVTWKTGLCVIESCNASKHAHDGWVCAVRAEKTSIYIYPFLVFAPGPRGSQFYRKYVGKRGKKEEVYCILRLVRLESLTFDRGNQVDKNKA